MILYKEIKDEIIGFYEIGEFSQVKDGIELEVLDYILSYGSIELFSRGDYKRVKARVYDKTNSVYIDFCFSAILGISFYYNLEFNKINEAKQIEIDTIKLYEFEFLRTVNKEGIEVEANDNILAKISDENKQKRIVEKALIDYFQENKKANIVVKYGSYIMNCDVRL